MKSAAKQRQRRRASWKSPPVKTIQQLLKEWEKIQNDRYHSSAGLSRG